MRYASGIVLAPQGGAFVVVEKCPRKRRGVRPDRHGDERAFEEWEDVLQIVGAERLTGPLTEMIARVADLLTAEPLSADCSTYIDVAATGSDILRLFYPRHVWPTALVVGAEASAGGDQAQALPLRNLHTAVTVSFEQQSLVALESLADAATLLRLLAEPVTLPATGPIADLSRAALVAVWAARQYPTRGPWPSSKPAKPGTAAHAELEAIARRKYVLARAKEEADRKNGRFSRRWDT